MASTLIKLTAILVMMNIFIYLGMAFAITAEGDDAEVEMRLHIKNDLLQKLVFNSIDDMAQSQKENFTDYDINFTSEFTTFPDKLGGEETGTGAGAAISFLDMPSIVFDFMKMMFNIAVSPITLFMSFRIPFTFAAIVGIPYLIIFVITVMAFMRGVGD
ncbi:hypothetical protein LCGC14_1228400 [marine sediment metagenome]|uniref:Uncharacterized protein n=1 Tax=marine sediment metagenome TaxID=412755 RepID=A0A0F9PDL9_9ZZZZ